MNQRKELEFGLYWNPLNPMNQTAITAPKFYPFWCRAGELSNAEIDNLMTIVANPRQFKIPDWFLNRKKDYKDGKYSQVTSNALDMKLRDDLERLKKIRSNFYPKILHLFSWFEAGII